MVLGQHKKYSLPSILALAGLYVLVSFTYPLMAQSPNKATLSGLVSSTDGEVLPGAQILLLGTDLGTVTNLDGMFILKDVPFGEHTIRASFLGYEDIEQTVVANQDLVLLDFHMESSTELLENVLITHDAEEQRKKEGYAIEVISTKPLQTQSIQLNQVLDQISGIRVRQSGGLGSRYNVTVNGLSGKAVRFFMDGIPMDYFGSSYSINTIPVSLIDRIEVYKGVVPVELGNDALGGAVNLVSKPNLQNSAEVSYSYGSFNTHRASVLGNWREKKSGFTSRLSAFYNYSDNNYKVWGDNIYVTDPETFETNRGIEAERFHDQFESISIKADLGFTQVDWADQFFFGVLVSDMNKEMQHGATMEVPFGEATYGQDVIMPYVTFQSFGFLTQDLDINLFASYSLMNLSRVDTSRNIYNWLGQIQGTRTLGGEQVRTLNELEEKAFLGRVNLNYRLSDTHTIGFNYVYTDLKRQDDDPIYNVSGSSDGYFAPQLFNKHSLGLTLQSTWLNDRLNTSLFVKWFGFEAQVKSYEYAGADPEYDPASDSSPGFGVAGSFELNSKWSLTASVESAVRLPEPNEILGDALIDASNPNLKAEKSLNANLGVEYKPIDGNNQLVIYTNGFYRKVQGLIQKNNYENPDQFIYRNIDSVTLTGVDTEVKFQFRKFVTLNQTISYLHPIINSSTDALGNENIKEGTRLPNTPFFQSNTNLFFTFGDVIQKNSKVFAYYNFSYVGDYHRRPENIGQFNKEIIPAQSIHSCGIGYSFPKETLSVSLDFSNIFNEQVFDNFMLQKPGRAAFVKATYRIM